MVFLAEVFLAEAFFATVFFDLPLLDDAFADWVLVCVAVLAVGALQSAIRRPWPKS